MKSEDEINQAVSSLRARLVKTFGSKMAEELTPVLEGKLAGRFVDAVDSVFGTYTTEELARAADFSAELDAFGSEPGH